MAGARSDFKELRGLIQSYSRIAARGFMEELATGMGARALELVHDGFERARDPYDRAWAPLKYRKGQPLRDTRRLEGSIRLSVNGRGGFSLDTGLIYARTHNKGRRPIPQRMFLPEEMPGPRWVTALERTGKEIFLSTLKARPG